MSIRINTHPPRFACEPPKTSVKQVREALARTNYQYGQPEILRRGFSGHKHLPEEVKKHIYRDSNIKGGPIRIDYYTVPTLFNLFRERFIAREIFIYDKNGDISYTVWTNEKNEIQLFVRKIPSKVINKDVKAGTEVRKEEFIYYDKSGILTKRSEWIDFIEHKKKKVTYIDTEYDAKGQVISKETGEAGYGDVVFPEDFPFTH